MNVSQKAAARGGKYWARLCALPAFSFLLNGAGGVARVKDTCGNWVELSEVQQIVDDAESRIAELERDQALQQDVRNSLELWAKGEWSEHPAKTPLGRELDAFLRRLFSALDAHKSGFALGFPELGPELEKILGMMCFQCFQYAQLLRLAGQQIPRKAEAEQAATIHWMLGHYFRSGNDWRAAAVADLERMKALALLAPQPGRAMP